MEEDGNRRQEEREMEGWQPEGVEGDGKAEEWKRKWGRKEALPWRR